MTKKRPAANKRFDDLRTRAENALSGKAVSSGEISADVQKLIHELDVHQTELEMQNEALRKSQMETAEEHGKYTDLFDFAPVGYFTFDRKGNIIEANVTGASLLGSEKRSLTGQPFRRFVTSGHFSIFQSHLQMALEIQSKQSCKLKLTRKDGSLFDALIDTIAVMDGDGNFDHHRSSVTDITDLKLAEAALKEVNETLEQRVAERTAELQGANEQAASLARFPEENPNPVMRVSTDGSVLYCNPASVKIPGWACKDGQQLPEPLLPLFGQAITGEQETQQDIELGERLYSVAVVPIPGKGYANVYGRDITERKRAEEILRERTVQLEAANKELESFSYSVSHDLRAPLRAIDGYARLILKKQGDKFDADTLDKFNVIRSSTHMMGQLIDDLLTFSRLGRKQMSLALLDMDVLMKDAWKELQASDPERNMRLTVNSIPAGYGDRVLIKQVLINLLSNAAKFTKYKDAANIEMGGYADGNEHVYYVRDNGVGFDMAYYDKLFGVFQRLHSTDHFEGTGVGLATVQRIIHRHGGRVWAEGKVDEGACFYFALNMEE
ncbi:MAG: ATP-binding protein [Syntrophales bacterium]